MSGAISFNQAPLVLSICNKRFTCKCVQFLSYNSIETLHRAVTRCEFFQGEHYRRADMFKGNITRGRARDRPSLAAVLVDRPAGSGARGKKKSHSPRRWSRNGIVSTKKAAEGSPNWAR